VERGGEAGMEGEPDGRGAGGRTNPRGACSQEAGRKREGRMSHQNNVPSLVFLVVGDFSRLLE